MYYHAKLEFSDQSHWWWDYTKTGIINELLIPFINGQVIVISKKVCKRVLNLKNVTLLTVYKTPQELGKSSEKGVAPLEVIGEGFEANECTEEIIEEVKNAKAIPSAKSVLQMAFAPPKNQVFVVMKFGSKELDSAYEGVIKPVIEEYGYKAIRIDELQDSGKITDQVLEHIATSKYILADLSGERPNCYYETGFAHALGKQLILTIKRTDAIHFDLAGYRFIQWETEAELRRELKKRFAVLGQEQQA
jgi:nucleoside 2-deoxyribosyltransferase